jgi:IMP dehydrogenase
MRMLHPEPGSNPGPGHELTYNDVFMVPSLSDVSSRMDVDLTTPDAIGTTIPLVVSNMTAVAGKRMAETVARRGGVAILPQDIPLDVVARVIADVKASHPVYETPITLAPDDTIGDALSLINKRAHGAVVVIDDGRPVGVFVDKDADGFDRFTQLRHVMSSNVHILSPDVDPADAHAQLGERRLHVAPVVGADEQLLGVVTRKGALRSTIYRPALDADGRLMIGVAVGINGVPAARAGELSAMGADVLVIDTAHGHQTRTLRAIESVRAAVGDATIVAGNVVTDIGTRQLIEAGADIVKVGVGPGAMCTTRMMTGVGRPQFTAVLECSTEAERLGAHVWADGGIRFPRDVALSLAAGASNVMIGSWLAGTFESAADLRTDTDGRLYKESFGMASNRAVKNRTRSESDFDRARKELFEEGISTSRMYLDRERPGVEDIIDQIVAGLRSSCTYAGAASITEFNDRAVVGVQGAAGYDEGRPLGVSW